MPPSPPSLPPFLFTSSPSSPLYHLYSLLSTLLYNPTSPSTSPPPSHHSPLADLAAQQSHDKFSTRKPAHTNHTHLDIIYVSQSRWFYPHHHLSITHCWWLDPSPAHPSTWASLLSASPSAHLDNQERKERKKNNRQETKR